MGTRRVVNSLANTVEQFTIIFVRRRCVSKKKLKKKDDWYVHTEGTKKEESKSCDLIFANNRTSCAVAIKIRGKRSARVKNARVYESFENRSYIFEPFIKRNVTVILEWQ